MKQGDQDLRSRSVLAAVSVGSKRWIRTSVVLPALALLSFGCAYRGWTIQRIGHEDAFFLSLEAIKLSADYRRSDGWQGNEWLEAARILGLLLYFIAIFKAFGIILRTQIYELVTQVARRDMVFVGDLPALGAISVTVAEYGRRSLWLGGSISPLPPRVRSIARQWEGKMFAQFRLKRAKACVVAFQDDIRAIDATLQISCSTSCPVIIVPSGSDTADAVKSLRINNKVRVVPISQPIVRALHERHPPFLAPLATGQSALSVLIIGRGGMAEAVATDILLSSLTTFLRPPQITFVAHGASIMAAEYAMRFPELSSTATLRFENATDDYDGRAVVSELPDMLLPVTNAYVCLTDDRKSLAAAAALDQIATGRNWPLKTIFVHQRTGGSVWRVGDRAERTVNRLVPFGASDDLARGLGLIDPEHDMEARRLHSVYQRLGGSKVAQVDWENLPEDLRDANRRQAAHLPAKLASAGVKLDGWLERRTENSVALPLPRFPDLDENPSLLDSLARLEHERWMADRRLNGWQYAKTRDDDRRHHPDLVPYDQLSQRSKNYDVAVVRALASSQC